LTSPPVQATHAIPANTQRIERRAVLLAVIVGIALLAGKFTAYALTGSAAIFTDAAESIVNVLASLFAAWAIWYAQQPPDERHRYGHGNIEFLSALFEGGMILMAALVAVARAAEAFWRGPELERLGAGLAIVAAAGAINGAVGLLLLRTGRRTGSLTLEADGRHLLTDAATSAVLLATLGVIALGGWPWLDPIAAVVLALYLGWEGLHLVRRGFLGLMDTSDPQDDALLTRVLDSHVGPNGVEPRVCSFHALRHRHVGRDHWVEFHLVVPRDWDIARGHAAATAIEIELQEALGHSDPLTPGSARATAHVEPCAEDQCDLRAPVASADTRS
jgi:cation diffusion facilitator family transporter